CCYTQLPPCWRRCRERVLNLPYLLAFANERPDGAVLAQLTSRPLHLAHRFEPLDDLVEENLQPLNVDRLGEVVVGAFLHRLDRRLGGALRGQQQRREVGALLRLRAEERVGWLPP